MDRVIGSKDSIKPGKHRFFNRYLDPGILLILLYASFVFVLILLGLFCPQHALAGIHVEGLHVNPWQTREGQLFFKVPGPKQYVSAPQIRTEAAINVSGFVAMATVRQQFINNTADWQEGIYAFPLPEDAAITSIRMHIGARIIEGRIEERKAAKRAYDTAKEKGEKASLLEQERPNIFTMSVANIGPGETVAVELGYQSIVTYKDGCFSLRFPTVIGPRYIPGAPLAASNPENRDDDRPGWANGTDQVPDAVRITPPVVSPPSGKGRQTAITVRLDTGLKLAGVKSLNHRIDTKTGTDGITEIRLVDGGSNSDRDFVLIWEPEKGTVPHCALFTETKDEDIYTFLMVMPPAVEKDIMQQQPRELVFIVDISGSMAGQSLRQSKEAMAYAISRLTPRDSFNIITFNHKADKFYETSRPANLFNKMAALRFVDNLSADGGTEMAPALELGLAPGSFPGRLRQIVFLTDGCVGNEQELFNIIYSRLGNSRLFTIGIGSAPNSYFMRNAAMFGRGSFTYIGNVSEAGDKITKLFQQLEKPVLTDIRLVSYDGTVAENFPDPIPDLYAGEPVMVVSKTGKMPENIILQGSISGMSWQKKINPKAASEQGGIATLWARTKIKSLMDSLTAGKPEDEVKQVVVATALRHHLVSRYTSLVAVDLTPSRPKDSDLATAVAASELPQGWQYDKVFGVPQTGTFSDLFFLLGGLSFFIALAAWSVIAREEEV